MSRAKRDWREWGILAFAGYLMLLFGVLAVAAYLVLPGWLIDESDFKGAPLDLARARTAERTTALQLVGGLVLLAGAYFTARTLRLNRAGHITDRFGKAIEHLGHDSVATRVGGVYALEQIMRDAPANQLAVLETLAGFLRHQCPKPATATAAAAIPPADAAAALRVIGRRDVRRDPPDLGGRWLLNLTELDLRNFSLLSGDFRGVNLWKTNLVGANFMGADVTSVAGLDEAEVRKATYDGKTAFPKGFDPEARGMIKK